MKLCPTRTAAALLVVSALAYPVEGQEKKSSPRELARTIAQADKLLAEGKALEARNLYLTAIKEDPANVGVASKLARISEDAQDWDGAIAAYLVVAANSRGVEQARAHAGLATAYVRTSKYAEAAESARKAIALDATMASPHSSLAFSLMRLGAGPEALSVARKAVELSPTSAMAHATLGEALLGQGQTADAEGSFRRALELDAKSGAAYAGIAEIQYRKGDFEATIASASKALEVSRGISRLYVIRGKANTTVGRLSAAHSDLSMALTVAPADAEAHLAYAQLQRKLGAPDLAISSYQKALTLDASLGAAYVELGELLIDKGEHSSARELLETAVQRLPTLARAHRLLGVAHEKGKQPDAALQAFDRAIEIDPTLAEAHFGRGKILREQKNDAAGAVPSLEKAVALKSDEPDFLTELGVALYDVKQADRTLTLLQKAAATPGYKNPLGFAVLGLALMDKQNFAEAVGWFEKASELSPKWWLPRWGAAWSYFGLIPKGCPCGPDDAARVARMKEHFDAMVSLQGKDPALEQRVDGLAKGQKVK